MPRKSRKSRAAVQRLKQKQITKQNDDYLGSKSHIHRLIRGNFHQGNMQLFSIESAGRQCSCNALVMLCTIEHVIDSLMPCHLDEMLTIGDNLYKTRSKELNSANVLAPDQLLDQTQLPDCLTIHQRPYTVAYKHEHFKHGRLGEDNSQSELNTWLQYVFNISDRNILILDGYMMALYKHTTTGQYLYFDSHSRDENGLVAGEGTSIVLIFDSLQNLLKYLVQLTNSLRARFFGLLPIVVHKQVQTNAQIADSYNNSKESNTTENQIFNSDSQPQIILNYDEDIPGCSTWNDVPSDTVSNESTYMYNNLPECDVNKSSNNHISENRRGSCDLDCNRQQLSTDHCTLSKRQRILVRKRQLSKDTYQDPEKAKRKRQQAKETYQNPEKAKRKRQQPRRTSKDAYQNPEKAKRKRQQARLTSKDAYQNPEKAKRKRQQAKDAYQNPEIRAIKIQQSQSNRSSRRSDLETVIINFQKSCQEDHLLKYICQICQRVHFKHQGQRFLKENYNEQILLKSFLPGFTIDTIPEPENDDDDTIWICSTCHKNMHDQKIVPRLAIVNNLSLQELPPQLSQLNMLERHLIAPAIPFMKMVSLIKGAQKGIYGQVVCVKADVNNTVKCLPRLPTDESLIRVKLKRKLEYKGHHMCQDVNPTKVKEALSWLKDNNPNYDDIDIDFEEFDTMVDDQLMHNEHPDQSNQSTQSDINNSPQPHGGFINEEEVVEAAIATEVYQFHEQIEHNTNDADEMQDHDQEVVDIDPVENDNITNTSAPLYSFLHPSDFAQYLADKHDESILSVAPGEGNIPQKVIEMESKCFPVEFPDSSNTYKEKRKQKISLSRYFNSRLFSADNRFARNPEYIFFALYTKEVAQFHSSVSIAIRSGSTKTAGGEEITASMLRDRDQVKKLIQRDEGNRFMKQIRGTPAFWEQTKRDLFAMIRQLGIPTFFVTFSAADRRWKEIDNAILISQGKEPMTKEQHKNMTWEQHCEIIMSNPVAAARIFQERVRTFISKVIMSEASPIGKVKDYFYRTEFQQRGWPHIHMVVWIENAPRFGEAPDEHITEFIDKYISCELPPESDEQLREIVTSVQTHSKKHTKSCRKTGHTCRFHFPRPPSNRTFICQPDNPIEVHENDPVYVEAMEQLLQEEKKAKDSLKQVWDLLADCDEETEWNDILQQAGISQDEFEKKLSKVSQKQTIYLKRRVQDQWINNYNPDLIRCWNGNMDIQYVLDAYACAMYIVSYITKSEREMGDLLKNAQKEASEGNVDATQQLRKLGSVYLQNREISVMGAIYQICSMPLKESTRKVIFLQTDLDGQKISLPLKQLQANAGKSEQVWMPTQIDKYINRPKSAKYNNMCMAKFFSDHYQVSSKTDAQNTNINSDEESEFDSDEEQEHQDDTNMSQRPGSVSNINENDTSNNASVSNQHANTRSQRCPKSQPIQLQKCNIKMKERTMGRPAVIRYPRVSLKKDPERYHMNMLRLYLPHRSKDIKPRSYRTYQSYHLTGHTTINRKRVQVRKVVEDNMKDFEPETDDLDKAWDALKDAMDLTDAWAALNPQAEQERLDDIIHPVRLDDSEDDFEHTEIPELQRPTRSSANDTPRCSIEPCHPEITADQAHSMMQNLNNKQRELFNYVSKWCDEKARDLKVEPFRIFLTGGAGTGKSHVINCMKYYASKVFAPMTESVDQVTVLLVAHTGTAAYNISGETICSALKIPAKSQDDYKPVSEETLNTLRVKYQHLQLVIVDEISMVNKRQLRYINGRLQQIKGAPDTTYFGNVSILAVGDFYQLPPVTEKTLYSPTKEVLKDIWNPLFQRVELTEIMRQRDDAIFAQMLNRLRVRKPDDPLQEMDIKLLESRRVKENGLTAPSDALHLFFLNKDVDSYNETKLASLQTNIHNVKAQDIDQKEGRVIQIRETPHSTSRRDDTCLVPYLKLAIGARAMLIANVDVSDGLCNGVSGIIKGLDFLNSTMPSAVYVKFDSDRIGTKTRSSQSIPPQYSGCVPIKPRKETFKVKGKEYTTTREQIPLKLAWAVTIHKVQGQTTERAVISMKQLKEAMGYVALSRVTSLQGLYLIDFDPTKIYCRQDVETNVANMVSLDMSRANPLFHLDHIKHLIIAHHNIRSLRCHLEDLKTNTQMRKAHIICLSETWLPNNDSDDTADLTIDGYSLETMNAGKYKGVAMFIQNSINYTRLCGILTNECDTLAIRTYGATDTMVVVVYKPPDTRQNVFYTEMNTITAQTELLDADHTVFVGDFNINLMKASVPRCFQNYHQVITEPTTTSNTLIDHIYIKPHPGTDKLTASVLPAYYSNHFPVFIAIKLRD